MEQRKQVREKDKESKKENRFTWKPWNCLFFSTSCCSLCLASVSRVVSLWLTSSRDCCINCLLLAPVSACTRWHASFMCSNCSWNAFSSSWSAWRNHDDGDITLHFQRSLDIISLTNGPTTVSVPNTFQRIFQLFTHLLHFSKLGLL